MEFARSFNGEHIQVGNLNFRVAEESVSRAIGLLIVGKKKIKGGSWKFQVVPSF